VRRVVVGCACSRGRAHRERATGRRSCVGEQLRRGGWRLAGAGRLAGGTTERQRRAEQRDGRWGQVTGFKAGWLWGAARTGCKRATSFLDGCAVAWRLRLSWSVQSQGRCGCLADALAWGASELPRNRPATPPERSAPRPPCDRPDRASAGHPHSCTPAARPPRAQPAARPLPEYARAQSGGLSFACHASSCRCRAHHHDARLAVPARPLLTCPPAPPRTRTPAPALPALAPMANGTRAAAAPAAPSNGVAGPDAAQSAATAVNRKKQKRREKEAAKRAAEAQQQPAVPANGTPPPAQHRRAPQQAPQYADAGLHADHAELEGGTPHDDEADFYSDEADDGYYDEHGFPTNGDYEPGYVPPRPPPGSVAKKPKKKAKALPPPQSAYHNPPLRPNHNARKPSASTNNRIWNTTTQEERERIREFWLSLGEDERKSLVKIEKEAVLRKMKEQQKHSCSCTVCGRKRTAIEEELEVLYDAYYEELEQYATHRTSAGNLFSHANYGVPSRAPRPIMPPHAPPGHYSEPEEYSGDDDEGDYSNSEISSEEDYSEEERSLPPPETADFLRFGNSLQVKGIASVMSLLRERLMHSPGGILTVADDLLKNDGKKFIEMMEQLAERRMQREEEAQYQAHPSMYRGGPHNSHHNPPPEEDDFDDEEEDEEGYEDGDYEDDEEDEEVRIDDAL
jgi:hypothetical protein